MSTKFEKSSLIMYSVTSLDTLNDFSVKSSKAGPPFLTLNLIPKSLSGPPAL